MRDLTLFAERTDVAAAKRRLKFEELFYLQLSILQYNRERKMEIAGWPFPRVGPLFKDF